MTSAAISSAQRDQLLQSDRAGAARLAVAHVLSPPRGEEPSRSTTVLPLLTTQLAAGDAEFGDFRPGLRPEVADQFEDLTPAGGELNGESRDWGLKSATEHTEFTEKTSEQLPLDDPGLPQGCDGQVLRRRHVEQEELLDEQKNGKAGMKQVGQVQIPQKAEDFLALFELTDAR